MVQVTGREKPAALGQLSTDDDYDHDADPVERWWVFLTPAA
jgi:hypothetical protein